MAALEAESDLSTTQSIKVKDERLFEVDELE